ncbi:MAG: hypothetical protein JXR48_18010 [Candidatus Delongbacteria bacterium]|nr:hypothetical protein [Candidatus Delongbacteria bacterium]MBN2836855.1 hypothetical protein [Candidatus Delongbacteria bacterium]
MSIEGDSQFISKKILNSFEGNSKIIELIQSERPFLISRFGAVELNIVNNYLEVEEYKKLNILKKIKFLMRLNRKKINDSFAYMININAGVFPNDEKILRQFSKEYIESSKNIDLLGIWKFIRKENYFIDLFCKKAILVNPESLEPYYHNLPWSKYLENKKVLVISPITNSIRRNYNKNRDKIYTSNITLPNFQLVTLRAVQSIAGNQTEFKSWFDALEYMKNEINKIDFDIAILGCGAYGLPLGSFIKNLGKQAIHMGGATQILFGIRGKRWDDHPVISKFYNEYWVRPEESEIPENANKVENGCYW